MFFVLLEGLLVPLLPSVLVPWRLGVLVSTAGVRRPCERTRWNKFNRTGGDEKCSCALTTGKSSFGALHRVISHNWVNLVVIGLSTV